MLDSECLQHWLDCSGEWSILRHYSNKTRETSSGSSRLVLLSSLRLTSFILLGLRLWFHPYCCLRSRKTQENPKPWSTWQWTVLLLLHVYLWCQLLRFHHVWVPWQVFHVIFLGCWQFRNCFRAYIHFDPCLFLILCESSFFLPSQRSSRKRGCANHVMLISRLFTRQRCAIRNYEFCSKKPSSALVYKTGRSWVH